MSVIRSFGPLPATCTEETDGLAAIRAALAHPVNEQVLAPLQWERAHRLAAAYGHEWPGHCERHVPMSASAVSAAVNAYWAENPPVVYGIPAPFVVPDALEAAMVVHTTMTGRTSWQVRADGEAVITIERPGGAVITAVVPGEGEDGEVIITDCSRAAAYGARHVAALIWALKPIVPDALMRVLEAIEAGTLVLEPCPPPVVEGEDETTATEEAQA
jgi:hypothetical protein